jgi:DNA end-binding protein Ku
MAKAKEAKNPETTAANVADLSSKLSDMLGGEKASAAAAPDASVPLKKTAGGKSTWKGTLSIPNPAGGILSVFAVKTYTATDEDTFKRHMYHSADCLNSLKYGEMACSGCGVKVSKSQAAMGVEADGKIILISDEEIAKMHPANEKSMKISEYIEENEINPIFYESTDFVAPDKGGEVAFAMLVETLKRTGKVAKGMRVSRGKEQTFVLRPYGQNGLTMHYLRADFEVRDASSLWKPVVVNGEMVDLFSKLTEQQTVPFTPAKQDVYVANCNALVEAKKAGTAPSCPTPETEQKQSMDDLLTQLKAATAAGK